MLPVGNCLQLLQAAGFSLFIRVYCAGSLLYGLIKTAPESEAFLPGFFISRCGCSGVHQKRPVLSIEPLFKTAM